MSSTGDSPYSRKPRPRSAGLFASWAVEDSARLRDYLVLIGSSQNSLAREREVISAFCSRQVDGLIVVPSMGSYRFLAAQIERGTKVVCMDLPASGVTVDTVLVDNRPAAREAVIRLLEQGHRRIGYFGDDQDIWPIRERYEGYLEARSRPAAAAAATELAALPDQSRPTALFTVMT